MSIEPRATYRVQLRPGFGFDQAAAIVGYLAELGVSHLYCSPYLQAAPGSQHGYDIVDYHRVNEELGGAEAHARLCRTLERHGLGQVLDMVPNHMAVGGPENAWWWDVLENGPASRYAGYFDVEWDPPGLGRGVEILLPVLGDQYGRVLEAGELKLEHQGGRFSLHYYDQVYPLAPRSLGPLLARAAEGCGSDELAFIGEALARLPAATENDGAALRRRQRDRQVLAGQLARLCEEEAGVRDAIDAVVAEVNADADALDGLLGEQNYRLAYWRMARHALDYRRFFNIDNLAALRIEDEGVFRDTHALVLEWLADGLLDGLRVDHPDGLRDPQAYLGRLRQAGPEAWIVVEKILEPGEGLRQDWPVAGTTGYDFLNRVNGLFVDPAGQEAMTRLYRELTGEPADYAAMVYEKKQLVQEQILGSDVNRLTDLMLRVCERHRRQRDTTRPEVRDALREVAACFPVYRTYVRAETGQVDAQDRRYVDEAVQAAKVRRPDLDARLFDFLREVLLLRVPGELEAELAMRFQQLTGPVMAKGVEDTAFYCFNRLASLNEVGGDPARFGVPVEAFHAACAETLARWPQTMLTLSTHDSKRSADVRARLNLLSEMPGAWAEAVRRWTALNGRQRGAAGPDFNMEYLLYQTLVGAWPIGEERLLAFAQKAGREAKTYTSWSQPDEAYEAAVAGFVRGALGDPAFVADLEAFVAPLVGPGRVNSLAQTLLMLTAPGVPDVYQGDEVWNLSLADPDNRRAVDFERRRRLLAGLEGAAPEEILAGMDEGTPKLWVVRHALALRRRHPEWFGAQGSYRPLAAEGSGAAHVVAFVRGEGAVTVVPRLVLGLGGAWGDTRLELPAGGWRDQLTGERVAGGPARVGRLLARFPVALLAREEEGAT